MDIDRKIIKKLVKKVIIIKRFGENIHVNGPGLRLDINTSYTRS